MRQGYSDIDTFLLLCDLIIKYLICTLQYVGDTGKGDSYLSEVIRVRLHGTDRRFKPDYVQAILKNIPKNTSRRLTFRSADFFKNEIGFYERVLPALLNFQSTKEVKDPFNNHPKLIFTYCDGVNDVVCLEDATTHSFRSVNTRQIGIDFVHCKLALKALAKYHAISFAMKDQKPEEFNKIKKEIFETYYHQRLRSWYVRFWNRLGRIAVDAVEKEYPGSIYVEKVKQFVAPERYDDLINAACNTLENGVISHGDTWTNNFLFKYRDAQPVDCMMLDFQLARCATPVLDISFMMYACTSQDMRVQHYDELLKHYYQVLSTQIREMGSDPEKVYSWDTFMAELKKYSFFGLAFSFESTPFIVLPPEDAITMIFEVYIY